MKDVQVKIAADVSGNEKVEKLRDSIGGIGDSTAAVDKTSAAIGAMGSSAKTAADRIDNAFGERAAGAISDFGKESEAAGRKSVESSESIIRGVKSISEEIGALKSLYLGLTAIQGAASSLSGLAATTDAYANLIAKIKLAVGEGKAFEEAFAGIQDVALRTNVSLEATGELFGKLFQTGKVSQAEALRLTESVNQAVQLSGASAGASEAAVTQLIQGLQSGVLRGDEFNSVMEQAPRLAKALADGLSVTTGELRKMADAGQLSSETVINALKGQALALEKEFSKLPPTIGREITQLQTKWQLWIGDLDQSKGASATVAAGIALIANNLDTLAASLMNAGQAYLGWKAYNIAAEMLGLRTAVAAVSAATTADTAATAANTVAKTVNTAATSANTVAQVANNAAKTGAAAAADAAAAGAGRLATAFSLIKGFSLAFLVTNLSDIGKWLGEAAAKAMGYGKVIEDNERQMKAAEKAAKDLAAADAELAQKKQLAADKALGLSERAKKLVADFGELTERGETTAAALAKIGKDLDLSNVKGIAEAGAALDALAQRGKITGEQVKTALQQALDGQDLQKFEVQARAAFDGSAQGARRLAAALEAQLGEALRRTGLDAGALANGVNDAAQRAINDVDVLTGRVDDLRKQGVSVGIALAASLDQAGKAATTETAAKAVLERWVELGNAGLVTGERLAEGLKKAQGRLDEIKPGINSLAEAFTTLGLKSREALQETEKSAREAFDYIKSNGGTLVELQAAWGKYADAAKAANGGILPDVLRLQEEMYKVAEAGRAAGRGIEDGLAGAGDAADAVTDKLRVAGAALDGFSRNTNGNIITGGPDVSALAAKNTTSDEQAKIFESLFAGIYSRLKDLPEYFSSTQGLQTAAIERDAAAYAKDESARQLKAQKTGSSSAQNGGGFSYGNVGNQVRTVRIEIPNAGKTRVLNVLDDGTADALVRLLQEQLAAIS